MANLGRPLQLQLPLSLNRGETVLGIIVAVLSALLTTVVAWCLHLAFPKDGFLFLDIPLVGIVAYYFGSLPGVVSGLVAMVAGWYLIIPPAYTLVVSPETLPILALFWLVLIATVEGAARLRVAQGASSRLAMIVESADDAILSQSLDGVILTWNAGAERLYGYSAAEAIGKPITMLAPADGPDNMRQRLEMLRRGGPIQRYESVAIRKDGTPIDVAVTVSLLGDASGSVSGASAVVRDISDRKRTERHQQFLVEAANVLGSSLDIQRTLEGLAALAVRRVTDLCTVDLVGEDGRVRPVAVVHHDPDRQPLASALREGFPSDLGARRLATEVIRTGRPVLYEDATDEVLARSIGDPRTRAVMRELGCRSMMVVPLTVGNRVLGALGFMSTASGRRYTRSDLAFAEELASHAAVAVDNARLHQAEQIQRQAVERLQAITAGLSKAITPADVASVVIDQALPAIGASAALVSLLSADGKTLEAIRDIGLGETLGRRWQRIPVEDRETPIRDVLRDGAAVFLESLDVMAKSFPGILPLPRPVGARAVLPLQTAGAPFGVMLFLFPTPLEFSDRDRALLLAIARLCAQALERARLYAHEHRVAETLQHALLPVTLPEVPGLHVHATYVPASPGAEIGGDWYDAFRLPDGRLALVIGDVVGHGVDAAVIMGQVRHSMRAAALEHRAPAGVLAAASEVLRLSHADEAMTTAVFGVLDPIALTFTYATAAHPAPIVAVDGRAHALATGGLPLGFLEAQPAPSWTVDLARGSLVVLYTDGLVEVSRDAVAGHAALLSAVERELETPSADPAARILERVVGDRRASDDIAIVVVALDAVPLERLDLVFPAAMSSLRPIRHAMQHLMENLGVEASRASAMIIATGEAVNNTIEHAYGVRPGTVHLRARRDGDMLRVEIEDRGRWRPQRADTRGGRGITLMRGLVDAMDMTTTETGTVVRLAIAIPSAAPLRERAAAPPTLRAAETPRERPTARRRVDDLAEMVVGFVGTVPVVSLEGDLDQVNVARFAAMLEDAVVQASGVVVLSLSSVSYLDSRGLQALLQVGRRIGTRRCRLVLVASPGSPARRLLDTSGVGEIFPVYAAVEDAAAAPDETVS
ncbi:MAG TPA: SpoIIE family protein phosphatase [bacterium]|nr:SpoIIE family protein phosphatase [bacterium]